MKRSRLLAYLAAAILAFSTGVGLAYAFDPARQEPAREDVALLPCPFCARLGTFAQRPCDDRYVVKCRGCGALGPAGETRDEAAQNWNLRLYNPETEAGQ